MPAQHPPGTQGRCPLRRSRRNPRRIRQAGRRCGADAEGEPRNRPGLSVRASPDVGEDAAPDAGARRPQVRPRSSRPDGPGREIADLAADQPVGLGEIGAEAGTRSAEGMQSTSRKISRSVAAAAAGIAGPRQGQAVAVEDDPADREAVIGKRRRLGAHLHHEHGLRAPRETFEQAGEMGVAALVERDDRGVAITGPSRAIARRSRSGPVKRSTIAGSRRKPVGSSEIRSVVCERWRRSPRLSRRGGAATSRRRPVGPSPTSVPSGRVQPQTG